jgi:glyoxylase-like metal-dependent hydrolase (beta-lactamase superfamily II)
VSSVLNKVVARTGAWTIGAILGLAICFGGRTGRAQQAGGGLEILQVRPNFYMIADAVSNVGVQIGLDGVVLVNTGAQGAASEVLTAIQKLTKDPIRYIINTSADADLVGGNQTLSKAGLRLGALTVRGGRAPGPDDAAFVMAHENVLLRMRAPSGTTPPFPSDGWPSETFDEKRKYIYFNGEGIEVLHQPAAHTDGDTVVFFRRSDVVAAGHIVDATRFPVIDLARGGSIRGEIDALNRLIELAIPAGPYLGTPTGAIATSVSVLPGGTEVLTGRGRIYRQIDVVNYRDMVVIIRDTIQHMIGEKKTLEQIKAAVPAKAWEPEFGATSGSWTTNDFVEAVYKSLTNEKPQPPAKR